MLSYDGDSLTFAFQRNNREDSLERLPPNEILDLETVCWMKSTTLSSIKDQLARFRGEAIYTEITIDEKYSELPMRKIQVVMPSTPFSSPPRKPECA